MKRSPLGRSILVGQWLLLSAAAGAAGPQAPPASQPGPSAGRRVEFAPGVTIDWPKRRIELEGRVVLREGLLELFACSPQTREHESIVTVRARPLHVFQALGLIGLEPGRPVTYDAGHERWLPPSGQPVAITVQFTADGRERTASIWDWMMEAQSRAPLLPREWVFCGSRTFPGNVFGADADGTVICVVDFDTALIGLPESHSADNSLLWVAARTPEIPPTGTACTLLIRAADQGAVRVLYEHRGRFRLDGRWLDQPRFAAALRSRLARDPGLTVRLSLLPGTDLEEARAAIGTIRACGVGDVHLTDPVSSPASQPAGRSGAATKDAG